MGRRPPKGLPWSPPSRLSPAAWHQIVCCPTSQTCQTERCCWLAGWLVIARVCLCDCNTASQRSRFCAANLGASSLGVFFLCELGILHGLCLLCIPVEPIDGRNPTRQIQFLHLLQCHYSPASSIASTPTFNGFDLPLSVSTRPDCTAIHPLDLLFATTTRNVPGKTHHWRVAESCYG